MEFWGVEVKPGGKKVLCKPGEETYLHVTQAALGESNGKNGNQQERVVIKVEVGNKEVVLGTLTQGKCDQMSLDLIFDRDIKLSHNGTQSSVYFCGYQTEAARDEFYTSDEEDDDEDDRAGDAPLAIPLAKDNGGPTEKPVAAKPQVGKEKVKADEKVKVPGPAAAPATNVLDDEDDEDDDEDDYEEDEDDDDEDDDEDEDDEDDDMEEDDAKPVSKKRGASAAAAVPTSAKKAKVAGTPEKQGSKTPEGGKQKGPLATPATDGKTKSKKTADGTPKDTPKQGKSPKKIGEYKCAPCSKVFTTESALSQHNSAKHTA